MTSRLAIAALWLLSCFGCIGAELPAPANPEVDRIYQYLAPSSDPKRPNLGAYLWIPPQTPRLRAVMVGMHNGLPINTLQSAPVRAVCRRHGIAQILLTPWAQEIGSVMMKDLTFDVSDPERTAIYDGYLKRLADLSGHPELLSAPIVPLGHSAFCGFPLEAAMRNPAQCLGAIPIKAGLGDAYAFFGPGGKALHPSAGFDLRHVPILFIASGSQETVNWSPYPHAYSTYLSSYRHDRDDNPGTDYEPHNELFGSSWDMMSGHFDMLPRNYQFVADWLEAVASARLPEKAGEPLKNLTLRDGWLLDPRIPAAGELPKGYSMPAPYLDHRGHRSQALWFPNAKLARQQFDLGRDEPRRKIELFTFLDPAGKAISLAHTAMAVMPDPQLLLHEDGLFTLTTSHFTTPPEICTVRTKDHAKHPEEAHNYTNLLFPGQTTMPLSELPLRFDAHGGALALVHSEQFKDERGVTETRFTLRLIRHRLAPDTGYNMSFVRVFHEGNREFAAAGRTCQIAWSLRDLNPNAAAQTIDFPAVPDAPASSAKIELKATSSAHLPVDYFVLKGPGIIQDGAFLPMEIPAGLTKPIEVTIGAYQVGRYQQTGGIKPADTVYQTFHLTP